MITKIRNFFNPKIKQNLSKQKNAPQNSETETKGTLDVEQGCYPKEYYIQNNIKSTSKPESEIYQLIYPNDKLIEDILQIKFIEESRENVILEKSGYILSEIYSVLNDKYANPIYRNHTGASGDFITIDPLTHKKRQVRQLKDGSYSYYDELRDMSFRAKDGKIIEAKFKSLIKNRVFVCTFMPEDKTTKITHGKKDFIFQDAKLKYVVEEARPMITCQLDFEPYFNIIDYSCEPKEIEGTEVCTKSGNKAFYYSQISKKDCEKIFN